MAATAVMSAHGSHKAWLRCAQPRMPRDKGRRRRCVDSTAGSRSGAPRAQQVRRHVRYGVRVYAGSVVHASASQRDGGMVHVMRACGNTLASRVKRTAAVCSQRRVRTREGVCRRLVEVGR